MPLKRSGEGIIHEQATRAGEKDTNRMHIGRPAYGHFNPVFLNIAKRTDGDALDQTADQRNRCMMPGKNPIKTGGKRQFAREREPCVEMARQTRPRGRG